MKKNIVVGGFTKAQREKELEKIKAKYKKKDYKFIEYIDNGSLKSIAIFEVNASILKKEKSQKLIGTGILFLILAVVLYISGGSNSLLINKNLSTFNVSDFQYTLDNKPAVAITIGESKEDYIDLTVHRANVKKGFFIDTHNNQDKKLISISTQWKGKKYFQNKDQAFVIFKILELDKNSNTAKISIEAKLYSNKNDDSITINTTATITDKQFQNLVMNI